MFLCGIVKSDVFEGRLMLMVLWWIFLHTKFAYLVNKYLFIHSFNRYLCTSLDLGSGNTNVRDLIYLESIS